MDPSVPLEQSQRGYASLSMAAAAAALFALAAMESGCNDQNGASSAPESKEGAPISEAWIGSQIGRPFANTYVQRKDCKGHFDVVTHHYTGDPPGFEVEGWAWDSTAHKTVSRIVFVDEHDIIVGGGHGGSERDDVPDALKEVTSKTAGWYGDVRIANGLIEAYAILDDGSACPIGSMKL